MEHYYTPAPRSKWERRSAELVMHGKKLCFSTASGVFSSRGIDRGSELLLTKILPVLAHGRILDLGCGYGFLGVSLAVLLPWTEGSSASIVMTDNNQRAVAMAKENAASNQVTNRVKILSGDGLAPVAGERFTAIISNPPVRAGKNLMHTWFSQAPTHLVPGGSLWIVLRKQQGAASMQRSLLCWFPTVECVAKSSGFWVLHATTRGE